MEPRGVEPRSPVQNPWCISRYTKVPSYYLYYFNNKFNLIFYLNYCKDINHFSIEIFSYN